MQDGLMNMNKIGALDQKIHTDEHIFGHIHMLMFVILMIYFNFNIFGQIYPNFNQAQHLMFVGEKFWSCYNFNVPQCEILANYWSN